MVLGWVMVEGRSQSSASSTLLLPGFISLPHLPSSAIPPAKYHHPVTNPLRGPCPPLHAPFLTGAKSAVLVPPRPVAISPHLIQDVGASVGTAVAATIWLKLWTILAQSGAVDSKDSRKFIHCGSGPLFLLLWPFFSADPSARLLAAGVPILQVGRSSPTDLALQGL